MECPTPGADVPSAAAFLSALDDVDTSSGRKKVVQTNIGKKSTQMHPGVTFTAQCVSAN